jgi:segregation and condensation protein B
MSNTPFSQSALSLTAQIESILFVASGAVTVAQVAAALETSTADVEKGLSELIEQYQDRGLRLQRHQQYIQITTAPESAPVVERFLGMEATARLSRAGLETLSIVAYEQPVTRPEIDAVRGVNSDGALKSLLGKGLIQEAGRAERPGRPILYVTTSDFLAHFGLNSLTDLPPLNLEAGAALEEQEGIDIHLKG